MAERANLVIAWAHGPHLGGDGPTPAPKEEQMRTSLRRRGAGLAATFGLVSGLLLVGAVAPVAAGVPVTLTVGTTQDLDASTPFNTELVVGYEVFQLTYNLLTEFDKDTNPAEGFADSWERFP